MMMYSVHYFCTKMHHFKVKTKFPKIFLSLTRLSAPPIEPPNEISGYCPGRLSRWKCSTRTVVSPDFVRTERPTTRSHRPAQSRHRPRRWRLAAIRPVPSATRVAPRTALWARRCELWHLHEQKRRQFNTHPQCQRRRLHREREGGTCPYFSVHMHWRQRE